MNWYLKIPFFKDLEKYLRTTGSKIYERTKTTITFPNHN